MTDRRTSKHLAAQPGDPVQVPWYGVQVQVHVYLEPLTGSTYQVHETTGYLVPGTQSLCTYNLSMTDWQTGDGRTWYHVPVPGASTSTCTVRIDITGQRCDHTYDLWWIFGTLTHSEIPQSPTTIGCCKVWAIQSFSFRLVRMFYFNHSQTDISAHTTPRQIAVYIRTSSLEPLVCLQ